VGRFGRVQYREQVTSGPPPALEIACDESGYEGDKLIDTTTDLFAHASVALDVESAADCIRELRSRIRSPAEEYKAGHILRQKHRGVLIWFLGSASPVQGRAQVFLVDKVYFVLRTLATELLDDESSLAIPQRLYRQCRGANEDETWHAFLVAAGALLRTRDRPDGLSSVDAFYDAIDDLRRASISGSAGSALEVLARTRRRAESLRRRLDVPMAMPLADPLLPAIISAVSFWNTGGQPIEILHDQQNTLSARRVSLLTTLVNASVPGRLVRLSLVDSQWDPRVQLADIIGGAVRKIASDELNGRGDPELTTLGSPFVSPQSIWGDDHSWRSLQPVQHVAP
jgi:hypothetical protein